MANRERPVDRGVRLGRLAIERIGREIRDARRDRGLSIDDVAAAAGISNAELSRIERHLSPRVPVITLARCAGAVGLDLTLRTYAGPHPIRDAAQADLLRDLRSLLHPKLRWSNEVPLPIPGDQRAWDGMILGKGWRFGVEAETSPADAQALARRLSLKIRDGEVDGLLLLVRDGRRSRDFLEAASGMLESLFPASPRRCERFEPMRRLPAMRSSSSGVDCAQVFRRTYEGTPQHAST
jgi:transcriptional regulator with XRE-family HTH domain